MAASTASSRSEDTVAVRDLPILLRKGRKGLERLRFRRQIRMAGLPQLLNDQLCRCFQRKDIGHARLVGGENDVSQCLPLEFQPHQAAKIIPVGRQLCAGLDPAAQPDTAQPGWPA